MTHRIRHLLVIGTLLATLSLVLPRASAQAQPQTKPGQRYHLGGVIVSASAGTFVVKGRGGRSATIHTTRSTRIIGRRQATLADIHAGSTVHVVADKAADGTLAARVVQDITLGPETSLQRRARASLDGPGPAVIVGSVAGRPTTSTLMVTTPTGERASVMVPTTARITRWVSITASNLTVGTSVMVQAVSNADGSLTALVVILPDNSGK
jgi:hypothetical protein